MKSFTKILSLLAFFFFTTIVLLVVTKKADAAITTGFQDSVVFSNLYNPTSLQFASDGRIFVAEKGGVIKVFQNLEDQNPQVFADLRPEVYDYWDRGLLSIVLHPNFPQTPYMYALYTLDAPPGGTAPYYNDACPDPTGMGCTAMGRLVKLTANGNVMAKEEVLIEDWCQQYPSHSVGKLAFGGDGALYASGGEGGSFTFTDYGQNVNLCKSLYREGGNLRSQSLERNQAGSIIKVYAAGQPTGTTYPSIQIKVNDQVVKTFANVQGNPTNRTFQELTYISPVKVRPEQIKVATPDIEVLVDKVTVDGVPYESEASDTQSMGTNASACTNVGYTKSEWLHCAGYFFYSQDNGPSTIKIFAAGKPGSGVYPTLQLEINNTVVQTFKNVQGDPNSRTFQTLTYVANTKVRPDQVRVSYINDWQEGTSDKDVMVDKITIDDVPYESESQNTYSVGSYLADSTGCSGGYKQYEWLHCNGYFLYGQGNTQPGDKISLSGTVIRVDPLTGAALPNNPLYGGRTDDDRIIAYGLRNPFRFAIPRYMSDLWVGDVGAADYEEINRIENPLDKNIHNFGWPCYEGPFVHPPFANLGYPLCDKLITQGTATMPFYSYSHNGGGASITGLVFYPNGNYPAQFYNALFFADYTQGVIKAMLVPQGADRPDNTKVVDIESGGIAPVDLVTGPYNDIFYPDLVTGTIHRIQYFAQNTPPVAIIKQDKTSGSLPLTVNFDGSSSSDPDTGDSIQFSWDLNGDGVFGDSTLAKPSYTYQTAGQYKVQLKVTDMNGASNTATVTISAGAQAPVVKILTPQASDTFTVGSIISFSGQATDPSTGNTLPPSTMSWRLILHHCAPANPQDCHAHFLQDFPGVASGSIPGPDHEYPSYLEIQLSATSQGLTSTTLVNINPKIVDLTFLSNISGITLSANGFTKRAPFTEKFFVNGKVTISAPSPQTVNNNVYTFTSWSDNGPQTHDITTPATNTSYTANYR